MHNLFEPPTRTQGRQSTKPAKHMIVLPYTLWALLLLVIPFLSLVSAASSANIQEWTDDQLDRVDEFAPEINRLYLFYADWCGACRRFKPKFLESAEKIFKINQDVQVIKINLDKAPQLGSRFRISHLPTVFHQLGEEFRKVDVFQNNLETFIERKAWIGSATMGPLSPPRGRTGPTKRGQKGGVFSIKKFIEDSGVSFPIFVVLVSSILLFITLFIIWCIWLYTDYKLNSHNFTEEAIKERIKFLRTQPEFAGEFDSEFSEADDEAKEDSGEESDTETEAEAESETAPLRGRRSSLKNRLK